MKIKISMDSKYNLLLDENEKYKKQIRTLNEQQLILKHRNKSVIEEIKPEYEGKEIVESKTRKIHGSVDEDIGVKSKERTIPGRTTVTTKTYTISFRRKYENNNS